MTEKEEPIIEEKKRKTNDAALDRWKERDTMRV